MKIMPILMNLCLNRIHGRESFLYKKVSVEDAQAAYLELVNIDHRRATRSITKFMELPKDEQTKKLEEIRAKLVQKGL